MEWLKVSSVDELKKLGKIQQTMLVIKKDIERLFQDKKSKDKNVAAMLSVKSNSWDGLYQKIIVLREVISYINDNAIIKNSDVVTKVESQGEIDESAYFKNKEAEYIFYLLELDGKQRSEKLNITMKCYSNKKEAKIWRDSIAKIIHPDICKDQRANEAICKLNQLYEDMVGVE